jgi:hypothetical protein
MRLALLIFVTLIVSFNASWLLWRDRLTPTGLTALPAPQTALQRQFGSRLHAKLAADLRRPLPADFKAARGLRLTLDRLREETGVDIVANYASLARPGGVDESAPLAPVQLGGRPLHDALPALLAAVTTAQPLGVEADGDALVVDLKSRLGRDTTTRVYDVRDLLPAAPPPPPPAINAASVKVAADAIVTAIQRDVAPETWRRPHIGDDYSRVGRVRHFAGQLIVQHTPTGHQDVVDYLNTIRIGRARRDFGSRAGTLMGGSVAAVLAVALVRRMLVRRAARLAGLCRTCGYDLRASSDRCPECGTPVATQRVRRSVAPAT